MDPDHFPRLRLLAVTLGVLFVATACPSGGSLDDLRRGAGGGEESPGPLDVEPPQAANPELTARVGLIIATNSETLQNLVDASEEPGVVVLFVQPDGPSAQTDIAVGDVITEVNGEASLNAERAVVQLRARPGDDRVLDVVKPDGSTARVTIDPQVPGEVDLATYYNPMVEQQPENPLGWFLRAQVTGRPFEEAFADAERAIDLEPSFVEAISLRGELRWNRAGRDSSLEDEAVAELRDEALGDWNLALRLDALNTRVLVSRSQAQSQIANASSARRDAQKARAEDPTFPGAHYAYALAEFVLGRENTAAAPAREAIDLNPFDVRYYQLLGEVFMRSGYPDRAEATVEAIIGLVEDQPTRQRLRSILDRDEGP